MSEAFYAAFAALSIEEQATAIRILLELNRKTINQSRKRKNAATTRACHIPFVARLARDAADPARNAALLLPGQDETERVQ